eukprot:5241678-Lingulodinium_polyedra.AAC.1
MSRASVPSCRTGFHRWVCARVVDGCLGGVVGGCVVGVWIARDWALDGWISGRLAVAWFAD